MSSKSEDFSLAQGRSPQSRFELPGTSYDTFDVDAALTPASMPQARRLAATYRPAYLNEDDTVIACCHHAHEVARAHGAREVMLEHLVHALARVASAAQVLDDRGIHVESLKRESAALISSEIPVDHMLTVTQLKASKDFNTVMFLAAAGASHRDDKATGVRDILEAILKYDPKSRAVRLLRKHAHGSVLEETPDPVVEMRGVVERYGSEARELRMLITEFKTVQANQAANTHHALDMRLSTLEKMIGSLSSEHTSERLQTFDRIKSIQDAMIGQRADWQGLQRLVSDRLGLIERSVGGAGGNGQVQALLAERFQVLQKGIETQRGDVQRIETGVVDRLKSFERALETTLQTSLEQVAALSDRIQMIEDAITSEGSNNSTVHALLGDQVKSMQRIESGLLDRFKALERGVMERLGGIDVGTGAAIDPALGGRIQGLERALEQQQANSTRAWTTTQERLQAVDRSLTAQRADLQTVNQALDAELEQIRKALVALGHAQQTLSTAIDEWRLNNSGDLSIISNRLAQLERSPMALAAAIAAPSLPSASVPASVAAATTMVINAAGASSPGNNANASLIDRVDRALKNRSTARQ